MRDLGHPLVKKPFNYNEFDILVSASLSYYVSFSALSSSAILSLIFSVFPITGHWLSALVLLACLLLSLFPWLCVWPSVSDPFLSQHLSLFTSLFLVSLPILYSVSVSTSYYLCLPYLLPWYFLFLSLHQLLSITFSLLSIPSILTVSVFVSSNPCLCLQSPSPLMYPWLPPVFSSRLPHPLKTTLIAHPLNNVCFCVPLPLRKTAVFCCLPVAC